MLSPEDLSLQRQSCSSIATTQAFYILVNSSWEKQVRNTSLCVCVCKYMCTCVCMYVCIWLHFISAPDFRDLCWLWWGGYNTWTSQQPWKDIEGDPVGQGQVIAPGSHSSDWFIPVDPPPTHHHLSAIQSRDESIRRFIHWLGQSPQNPDTSENLSADNQAPNTLDWDGRGDEALHTQISAHFHAGVCIYNSLPPQTLSCL